MENCRLEKIKWCSRQWVAKNTKFNTLKTEVNNLEKKNPDATILIHINQYNIDKLNLEKKIGDVHKKISGTSGLVTAPVLNTNISEVENKISDNSKYITTQEFNKLMAENFAARLKQAYLVKKNWFW